MFFGGFFFLIILFWIFMPWGSSSCRTTAYYSSKTPLDILTERYVNGEIDEAEYLKKKQVLSGK